jgi:hypothetical protein
LITTIVDLVDLEEEDSNEYRDTRKGLEEAIEKGAVVIYQGKEAPVSREVEEVVEEQ